MQAVENYADAKILRWGLSSVLPCILWHLSWSSYVWGMAAMSIQPDAAKCCIWCFQGISLLVSHHLYSPQLE